MNCIQRDVCHPALVAVWQKRKSDREIGLVFFMERLETLGSDVCFRLDFYGDYAKIFQRLKGFGGVLNLIENNQCVSRWENLPQCSGMIKSDLCRNQCQKLFSAQSCCKKKCMPFFGRILRRILTSARFFLPDGSP